MFVEAVAVEAVGGEDRLDVAGVGEPPGGLARGRGCVRGLRHEAQPRDPVEHPSGDEFHARVVPVVGIAEGGVKRVDGGGARQFVAQLLDGGVVGRVARHEPCHHDRRVAADLPPQSGEMLLDGRFPLLQWRARDRVVDAERKKDDGPHLLPREQSLRRGDPAAKRLEIHAVSRPLRDLAAPLAGLHQVDRQALLRQPLGPVCQLQFETVCFRGLEPRVAQQIVGADVEGPEGDRVIVEDLHRRTWGEFVGGGLGIEGESAGVAFTRDDHEQLRPSPAVRRLFGACGDSTGRDQHGRERRDGQMVQHAINHRINHTRGLGSPSGSVIGPCRS